MNKTVNKPRFTLLSLTMTNSHMSVQAAFELVQKFSFECGALLVNLSLEESGIMSGGELSWGKDRETIIKESASQTGVETNVLAISFEDSLSRFKCVPSNDVLLLLQPIHPLERQSPSFIQLSEEIYKSPGIIIYLPDHPHKLNKHILLIGQKTSQLDYSIVQSFLDESRLPLKQMDFPGSVKELQKLLLATPRSERPALLLINSAISGNSPLAFFKIASLTGVPVGIIPNRNIEQNADS